MKSSHQYVLNAGQYVYQVKGENQTAPSDAIALALDKDEGVLHKHGDPEKVRAWATSTRAKLIGAGAQKWADNLVVVEGRFPLEEINKCLDISGYCKIFFEKAMRGDIQGLSYDQAAGEAEQFFPLNSPNPLN